MAYADLYALAGDATLQHRVAVAAAITAVDVQAEPQGSMSDAHYSKRQTLSRSVLLMDASAALVVRRFTWITLMTTPTLTGGSSDVELLAALVNAWDVIAGVTSKDLT